MRAGAALLGASLLLQAGCSRPAGRSDSGTGRLNVLVVTLDTTRADHLGSYGHSGDTSPRLDALAAGAVRFERAHSTSGLTPMAHASIFTGLFPHRHGLRVFYGPTGNFLKPDPPTLAGWLGRHGYDTAAFVSAYTASQRYGLDRGFETFDTGMDDALERMDLTRQQRHEHSWHDGPWTNTQRRGDATTDAALEWLDRAREPFLLWVHYFDPHDPSLVPPPEFLDRYGIRPGGEPQDRIAIYDPEIRYMDSQIGRLLDRLRDSDRFDSTLVVVLADHGQGLLQHGWMRHRLLYQEEIRIPLIIRVPDRIPEPGRGTVVDSLVRNVDVFPTVLDYLDLAGPTGLDGLSLRPLMEDGTEPEPRFGFAEALNTIDTHSPSTLPACQQDLLFAILEGDWKLIYHREKPENSELYDLADDPLELSNLFGRHHAVQERLMARLRDSGALRIEVVQRSGPEDSEMREKLRSLGYVQ